MPTVHTGRSHPDLECSSFEEGENGLILKDGRNNNIGWVPFGAIQYVEPDS